jgi:hypothetical protein
MIATMSSTPASSRNKLLSSDIAAQTLQKRIHRMSKMRPRTADPTPAPKSAKLKNPEHPQATNNTAAAAIRPSAKMSRSAHKQPPVVVGGGGGGGGGGGSGGGGGGDGQSTGIVVSSVRGRHPAGFGPVTRMVTLTVLMPLEEYVWVADGLVVVCVCGGMLPTSKSQSNSSGCPCGLLTWTEKLQTHGFDSDGVATTLPLSVGQLQLGIVIDSLSARAGFVQPSGFTKTLTS